MNCQLSVMKDGKILYFICRHHKRIVTPVECEICQLAASRLDLQTIQTSLPKRRPGKDRYFEVHGDGSIVYAQEDGEWEPPKDINGYRRDPENPWRFIPLWPKCMKRIPKGTRTQSCGCLQLTMVCDNPTSELHTKIVSDVECQQCLVRDSKGE